MGILDRIPAPIRHALIGLAAALLAYLTANYTTWGLDTALYPLIGAVLTIAALWLTPLTKQYGLFSDTPTDSPADIPAV